MKWLWIGVAAVLAGCSHCRRDLAGDCSAYSVFPSQSYNVFSLRAGDLESAGLAFITPSTVTGQEQEKQAVAMTFTDVLKEQRPKIRVVSLAETLSAVNRSGLGGAYKRMYDDYRDTGLFDGTVLSQIGKATDSRYIVQLKLQGFSQASKGRFGALGLRLIETQYGDVRLFVQVWDSSTGAVAWEGMQELRLSFDTGSDEPVTLKELLERTTLELIRKLP